jgi:hypothetical protein
MLKRLMVLGGMLAMMLIAAAPAMAQAGPVTATGVLGEPYTEGEDPTINYSFTDEATGDPYVLTSGFVDLEPYVGQRITVEAAPIGTADGATPALNVTSIKGATFEDARMVGVIQPVAQPSPQGPTHIITDEAMGDDYGLFSDAQGVDLSQYEGQRVAIQGIYQNMLTSQPESTNDVLVYVTSVEILNQDPAPVEDAKVTGVISPNPQALIPGGEPTSHLITEDGTGDVYMISSYGQGPDLASYEGQHVTIYGIFQTLGNPLSNFEDLTQVPIAVTSLEVLEDAVPSFEPDAIITGVIQPTANPLEEGSTHTITEDGTGDEYGLFSDAQGVDLSQYVGQRATITGYFQTQGTGTAGYDLTDLLIYVTSIEVLDAAPDTDNQYGNASTVVENPATEDVTADDPASDSGVLSVLPDTGGFSLAALGLVALLLLGGGGLLAYGLMRR